MKYVVKRSNGTYDTTLYNESNQNIINFHAERGETLEPVQGLSIEWDEDGEPISVTPIELSIEQWRQTARVRTWQLKAILDEDNLLETVEAMVAQSPKAVQLAWNHAPDVMRSSQAVNQILEALQLTAEQGDEIFIRAKELEI